MFPTLQFETVIFLFSSFSLYWIIGYWVSVKKVLNYKPLDSSTKIKTSFLLLFLGYIIEFAVEREIPFFNMLSGGSYTDYSDYGIKSFHVFLVTYNSFLSVYYFHFFVSNKKKRGLIYFILSLIPAILIVNRGMILMALFSSFFVFIQSVDVKFKPKYYVYISFIFIIVLYFFGLLGNIRSGNGDPNYILAESDASATFIESSIPKEFYWTYLYGASPLGNFQNNINKGTYNNYNFFDFILFELTPELISKRIALLLGRTKRQPTLMKEWLTVGTVYSKSYSYLWWIGPIILSVYISIFILVILSLVPNRSKYHVSTVAILSTFVFLNTFTNMIVFSGIILQLFFPIFLSYFEGKKIVIKNNE